MAHTGHISINDRVNFLNKCIITLFDLHAPLKQFIKKKKNHKPHTRCEVNVLPNFKENIRMVISCTVHFKSVDKNVHQVVKNH
jgi:hypothetical protein